MNNQKSIQLLNLLNSFHPDNDNFYIVIQYAFKDLKLTTRQLADQFEFAESTIKRWYKNQAKPARLVQCQVVQYLKDL